MISQKQINTEKRKENSSRRIKKQIQQQKIFFYFEADELKEEFSKKEKQFCFEEDSEEI